MLNVVYELRGLCKRNCDGAYNTQADRIRSLSLMGRQLNAMGFKQMKATSLKEKHVEALLKRWKGEGLAISTIKNRLAHLRWWAEKIGRAGIVPADNAALGVPERKYVTNISKAKTLEEDALAKVTDEYVKMSLRLQAAFGLRREEAIKFQPDYADQGDDIQLKGSWTKGGRVRCIPVLTDAQREVLKDAHDLVGTGSLIPADKTYIEQRNIYDGQCKAAGLSKMHGLRHHYAQSRYEILTGWKAPALGGPSRRDLSPVQQIRDAEARSIISAELGHGRGQITAVYLGR